MKFLVSTVLVSYLFCLHYGCEAFAAVNSPEISSADAKPQLSTATVIAGLQTVGAIMQVARELVNKTTFKDISKLHVVPYHTELAASYGKLNADSVKEMDNELKVMIAAVDRKLTKLHEENKDGSEILFDDYVSTMMQNPLIEKDFDGEIFRDEYKEFSRFGFAKNGIDQQVVNEVETWFLNLIDDSDVLASTKINILDFANIVGCTDAFVEDLQTLFLRNEQVERSILEVGVLRYPDLDNPFFKMFRIKLKAYRKSLRVAMIQKDESGIKGEYNMHKFRPRNDIIKKLRQEVVNKAIAEVESLFSF